MTFREFVDRCNQETRSSAEFVWIPRDVLHRQGLDPAPFGDPKVPSYLGKFPVWQPEPERVGFFQISSKNAFGAGWSQRPFAETAADNLWSIDSAVPATQSTDELAPEVEGRVLERWITENRSRAATS